MIINLGLLRKRLRKRKVVFIFLELQSLVSGIVNLELQSLVSGSVNLEL